MPRTAAAVLAPIAEPAAHEAAGIVTPAQTAAEVAGPQPTAEPAVHGNPQDTDTEQEMSKKRGARKAARSKAGMRRVRCHASIGSAQAHAAHSCSQTNTGGLLSAGWLRCRPALASLLARTSSARPQRAACQQRKGCAKYLTTVCHAKLALWHPTLHAHAAELR